MAPSTLSCDANGCEFTTAEFGPAVAVELLKMHHHNQHVQVQQPPQVSGQTVSTKPRAETITRPEEEGDWPRPILLLQGSVEFLQVVLWNNGRTRTQGPTQSMLS